MNDLVTVLLIYADGGWGKIGPKERWIAEWDLLGVGFSGYWEGRRVTEAQIYPGDLTGKVRELA